MAPKAISPFDQSTVPRVHIPISNQRVLTVSAPCACSGYPAPSLGVARNSTGSLGKLYPNFHFWLKSESTCTLRSEPHLADPPPGGARRPNYFFIFFFMYTPVPKKILGRFSADTRVPQASKQLSQTSYIYIYVSRVGHTISETSVMIWQSDEKRLRRD